MHPARCIMEEIRLLYSGDLRFDFSKWLVATFRRCVFRIKRFLRSRGENYEIRVL